MSFSNEASKFVYIRTYSRWKEEEKRRETWEETVTRYVNFLYEERGKLIPSKVLDKIYEKIVNLDVMPSMRAMWAAGDAARKENLTMYNCSFLGLSDVTAFAELFYILMCGAGGGFSVENKYISQLPSIPKIDVENKETVLVEDSREAWADSIKILMNSLYSGKDIDFDYSAIRPKGARLKTMGGRASGPAPLITLHNYIKDVFFTAQGRKLKSIECHDIANQIADSVVVGGVRRSSEISLSDLNDEDMRNAKIWPFPPRRAMANNSAVYYEKPSAVEFLKEWAALAASGTGERGISNIGAARLQAPKRRNAELLMGSNPCVVGATEILTKEGYRRIDELVDQEVEVWNGFEWSLVTPKITGKNQKILRIELSSGQFLECTPYHNFILATDYKGNIKKVKAEELEIGDKLFKHGYPILEGGKEVEYAYSQGFVSAEGMEGSKYVLVYYPKVSCIDRLSKEKVVDDSKNERYRVTLNFDTHSKEFVPFNWNIKSRLDWLAGLMDGDGTELREGGAQIVSINKPFLLNVQKLLTTLGISSKVSKSSDAGERLMPDGKGGMRYFYCQEAFRLLIGATQIQDLKLLGLKCERLKFEKSPNRDASQFVKVVSVEEMGEVDTVYCFNEPKRHLGCFNGIVTGQCHEILLRDAGLCNLSEVVIKATDDVDDLIDKIETATWIGAIQSTFTNFPYLSKRWKENCEEERLLGVSLTGQMDNPDILTPDVLKLLKLKAQKVARHAAQKLDINMPAAITTVKPSGTVSQVADCSSGIHPRYSQYYIRRYRISSTDSLFRMMKSQGIKMEKENGQEHLPPEEVTTWVVSFPMAAPKGAITRHDMSAIDQLEWYKKIQKNYCEHNASMTVYVKENEWFDVGNWVYNNWDIVNGISFLPHDGGKYKLAPYEDITKEEYEKLVEKSKPIDYSELSKFETEDNTEGAKMLACSGDKCEII